MQPPAEDPAREEWMARFQSLFWDLEAMRPPPADGRGRDADEDEPDAEDPRAEEGPPDGAGEGDGGVWRAEVDRVLHEWNGRLRAFFRLEEPSPGVARWLRSRESVFRDWNRRFRELLVWRVPLSGGPLFVLPPWSPGGGGALRDWPHVLRTLVLCADADADGPADPVLPVVVDGIDDSPYLLKPSSYLKALPDHQLEAKWHGRTRSRSRSRSGSAGSALASAGPASAESTLASRPLPAHPPRMSVCIMVVGTRGDVQPFLGVAARLRRDGHRVRLATHALYRDLVARAPGVEFYPLGGDPTALAAYMVKTGGRLLPVTLEALQKDVPRNMRMIDEILASTWPAVSAADPDAGGPGVPGEPFRADAIISNPVTYGHVHVAEKLGVPLHIMFPQPWVPTVAFPHPLANLPYTWRPQRRNYLSYKLVDLLMWEGTERLVNRFRTDTLGLRRVRKGDGGRDLLLDRRVPHAFMWSPHLVPKPADWGDLYDVIGTVALKQQASVYTPSPDLEAFLGDDGGPIFVGFGSMVLEDPLGLTNMIIAAAERAQVRVLIQSSWSDMAGGMAVPDNVFFLGNCPHDWLMPRVSAVVHHGGAGTTAAGLLAGKPTFIVPFFGDQPFWGRAVVAAGVGVEPCPIAELTTDRLASAMAQLLRPELRALAERLGERMHREDGVEAAVQSFYRHLPTDRMWCDACRERVPSRWSVHDRAKLCARCGADMQARPENYWKRVVDYRCVNYRARREAAADAGPRYYHPHAPLANGGDEGGGLAHELTDAVAFLHEVGAAMKDVSHFLVLSCFSSWDVVAVV